MLLPRKYTEDAALGEQMVVFVYTDSEDRPVPTTLRPTATVGDFAYLRVIAVPSLIHIVRLPRWHAYRWRACASPSDPPPSSADSCWPYRPPSFLVSG